MNTKSTTEFQWSVKLVGNRIFRVGIATKLERSNDNIHKYDIEAIFYSSGGYVWDGQKKIRDSDKQKSGDVLCFTFHPLSKKLSVELSSSVGTLKGRHWCISVAVKDNINYFPFAQLVGIDAHEAILI